MVNIVSVHLICDLVIIENQLLYIPLKQEHFINTFFFMVIIELFTIVKIIFLSSFAIYLTYLECIFFIHITFLNNGNFMHSQYNTYFPSLLTYNKLRSPYSNEKM